MESKAQTKKVCIDLGSGLNKEAGWTGYDKYSFGGITDIVMNLDDPKVNLGFGDNAVDEIRAYHFLEHINNLFPLINECHRVLKPEGIMDIVIPFGYTNAHGDPTHIRVFSEESWHYFTSTPPGNYINPEIKGFWKILKNDWTPYMTEDTEKIVIHKRRELHVIMQPEKEIKDDK